MCLLPYPIRRSARARHARLTVTREGRAIVVLPMRAPESAAIVLVARHAAWLERQLDRVAAERARLSGRPSLAVGRPVSVAGQPRVLVANTDEERRALELRLRGEAAAILTDRVRALAALVGVSPQGVTIRANRSRWGSASARGRISLDWRLCLAPIDVMDYVLIHELVHLAVPGHPPRFWSAVRRHAPQADAARRWLREHQAELQAVLD